MAGYDEKRIASLLPIPADDANKYSRGKLILFTGSTQYPGAAILAARAAQRAGAGYTQLFTSPTVVPLVQASCPSVVVASNKEVFDADFIPTRENRPCAYVVGPGFHADKKSTHSNTRLVLEKAQAPVLVDGGALQVLTAPEYRFLCSARKEAGYTTLITPHWGEALMLAEAFGLPIENPAQLSYSLSLAYDAMTVIKGPDTYISDGERVFSISQGSAALAKAGTGDVLSGIMGAFLAQGLNVFDAAVLGVSVHARSGCRAEEELTSISVTAEDVIEHIPAAFKEFMRFREK